jgi:hypothetical protein
VIVESVWPPFQKLNVEVASASSLFTDLLAALKARIKALYFLFPYFGLF